MQLTHHKYMCIEIIIIIEIAAIARKSYFFCVR